MEFLLFFALLALSAVFSGTETAFFSLGAAELAKMAQGDDPLGVRVAAMVQRSHDLLSALLIGNLLVNIAAGVVATAICLRLFGPKGVAVAVPAVTIALLIFGEITPKMLALRSRERVARLVVRPLEAWLWFTGPLIHVIGRVMERLLKALPWDRTGTRPLTTLELQTACDLAVIDGTLSETEGRSLARLLLLEDLEVRRIMTPRTETVILLPEMSLAEVLSTAQKAGFNRYPVMDPQTQRPAGMFHLKDLLGTTNADDQPLSGSLRELLFVPESKDVAALLTEMRGGGTHLAAVVDEHGDFTGIVTMADCLQAFMGQVGDTTGPDPELIPLGNGRWVILGRTDPRELAEVCGINLPPSRDYVTVAGFLMARLGCVLQPGDRVTLPDGRLTVLEMTGHRVDRIQVTRLEPGRPVDAVSAGGAE